MRNTAHPNRHISPLLLLTSLLFCSLLYAQTAGEERLQRMLGNDLLKPLGYRSFDWTPSGDGYYIRRSDPIRGQIDFLYVDAESGRQSPLFTQEIQAEIIGQFAALTHTAPQKHLPFSNFSFTADGSAIRFKTNGSYYLFDLSRKKLSQLKRPEIKPQPGTEDLLRNMGDSQIRNGSYSAGQRFFAYIKGYDLYYTDTQTGEETRITLDGSADQFYGRPDWVYAEEFFQVTGYWWSPDGSMLAYYAFDSREVYKHPIVHDLQAQARLELQSFPLVGSANPKVRLFVYHLESGKNVAVETAVKGEHYIIKPQWSPKDGTLFFQRLNRRQNTLEILAANPENGSTATILQEHEETYINVHDNFRFLNDGRRFLWTSEKDGGSQLYLHDLDGGLSRQLTNRMENPVHEVLQIDSNDRGVYYTAFTNMAMERHLFRVDLDSGQTEQLTHGSGYHRIRFAPGGTYFADAYTSLTQPERISLHDAKGRLLHTIAWYDSKEYERLELLPPEHLQVLAADGETKLNGLLFKPADFDEDRVYPLIVSVYGGPGVNLVRNDFFQLGEESRLAQLGFLVWRMDNRGTPGRNKAFERATYLKLGQIDFQDQVAGLKQITQKPYVDGSRIGIYGGSYGGYLTCMALLKEPELFHVGVASSSGANWYHYDTIYTERYMRKPDENPEGYRLGSVTPYAGNLAGKLLITTGTIDNNAHLSQSMELVRALIDAGRQFRFMPYPGQRHGIRGLSRNHLFQLRRDFFTRHLKPETEGTTIH